MTPNSSDTSLRIYNSIEYYGLDINCVVLVGGASISSYLDAFRTDLFICANENDVQEAVNVNYFSMTRPYKQTPLQILFLPQEYLTEK